MKKISAILLSLILVMALAIPAFAANNGKITIDNAVSGQTYSIYKILDLESYDKDADAYLYKATAEWSTFLNSAAIKGVYVNVDDNGYVTWVTDASAKDFAAKAIEYAKENGYTATDSKTADATTVEFSNLALGYYLVDSSVGALCALTTTDNEVTISDKNDVPTVEKTVKSGADYAAANSASIGDTVEFKVTINAKKGAENYVYHDKMSAGLTLDAASITVEGLTAADYVVNTTATDDDDTFEISFAKAYLDTITADTAIVITYSATINENAVVGTDGNTNDGKLTYGDDNTTTTTETTTYTYSFDLVKTDDENTVLTGAKFKIYDAETAGNEIAVVADGDGYRVALEGETGVEIEAGNVTIKGLAAGTYYLEETVAPDGYNKLTDRQAFTIADANLDATVNGTTYANGGVQVVNNSGSILPTTGGIGTYIFYIIGALLILGAAITFIVKRKVSAETNA